jgi:hypothetical protein
MNWEIDYSPIPVYIRVVTSGIVTADDHSAMWDELLKSGSWKPGTGVLFEAGSIQPLGAEGYRITQQSTRYLIQRKDEIGSSCVALVLAGSENTVHARQLQYAVQLRGSSMVIRNFADEASAIDWLRAVAQFDRDHTQKSASSDLTR